MCRDEIARGCRRCRRRQSVQRGAARGARRAGAADLALSRLAARGRDDNARYFRHHVVSSTSVFVTVANAAANSPPTTPETEARLYRVRARRRGRCDSLERWQRRHDVTGHQTRSERRGAEPTAADAIRSTTEWPLRTADRLRLRGGRRRREVRDLRNPAPRARSETDGEPNREGVKCGEGRGRRARGRAQRSPLHRASLYITLHSGGGGGAFAGAREKRSPRRGQRRGTPTEFKQVRGDRP